MCDDDLPRIEELPRRTTTDLRNKFPDVVDEVRAKGLAAITYRGTIEAVLIDATTYRTMTRPFASEVNLAELTAEFDQRLAALQKLEVRKQVDAIMNAQGETKRRPKAGDF